MTHIREEEEVPRWVTVCGLVNHLDISVRMIQGKVDRTDPVLISLCSSVVQYRARRKRGSARELIAC